MNTWALAGTTRCRLYSRKKAHHLRPFEQVAASGGYMMDLMACVADTILCERALVETPKRDISGQQKSTDTRPSTSPLLEEPHVRRIVSSCVGVACGPIHGALRLACRVVGHRYPGRPATENRE